MHRVEGFTGLYGKSGGSGCRFILVESGSHEIGEWQEGCGGGVQGSETVLGVIGRQRMIQVREGKGFQHFRSWAQEGDRSVVKTFICRFDCFWDGDDESFT